MDTTTVLLNLAGLVPLSAVTWWLAIPRQGNRFVPAVVWWGLFAIAVVPLGGFLAALVAATFGEPLRMPAFSWVERPAYALGVVTACGLVGVLWTLGFMTAMRALLSPRYISRSGPTV